MAGGIRFEPNRKATRLLAVEAQMRRALGKIAEDGAAQVEAAAPRIVKQRGSRIYSETAQGPDGWEGRVIVRSPFWHFPEIGHSRYPPRPYLRPTVQKLISRYGGRFKSQ